MDHTSRRNLRLTLGMQVRDLSKRSGVDQHRLELAEIGIVKLTPEEQAATDEVLRHAIKERTTYFSMALASLA